VDYTAVTVAVAAGYAICFAGSIIHVHVDTVEDQKQMVAAVVGMASGRGASDVVVEDQREEGSDVAIAVYNGPEEENISVVDVRIGPSARVFRGASLDMSVPFVPWAGCDQTERMLLVTYRYVPRTSDDSDADSDDEEPPADEVAAVTHEIERVEIV
jgi:hypothetical protein